MPSPSSMLLATRPNRASAPPPDPSAIFGSKLMSWHRGDLGVTLSGGSVVTWADQSGNGRTFDGPPGDGPPGLRPTMGTLAGQDAILFTGASMQYLEHFGLGYGSPSAFHVIRVMQRNADPPASGTVSGLDNWGTSAARSHVPFTDGVIYDSTGAPSRATVGNPTPSLASPRVYESISTAAKWEARLDGAVLYSGGPLGVAVTATPWIGGGPHGAYMDGTIAEVIVLNAEASSGERVDFAAYILDRYGLTIA